MDDLPIVDIVISGGCGYVNSCPPGVRVRLRDYDTEGEGENAVDEEGNACLESIYTAEDFI